MLFSAEKMPDAVMPPTDAAWKALEGAFDLQVHVAPDVIEHCFTTTHTGKAPWDLCFDNVRAIGPERCLLSSDLGQTINPPVADGLASFAQPFLDAGFSAAEVRQMAVVNAARLVEL